MNLPTVMFHLYQQVHLAFDRATDQPTEDWFLDWLDMIWMEMSPRERAMVEDVNAKKAPIV